MDEPEDKTFGVKTYKAIVNPFSVKWWREPRRWWRERHLRHDILELEDEDSPMSRRINEELDRAVLGGEDIGT